MRMTVPWTGSPGRLKSIYSINLEILAKLEIFCLTLCKTWYKHWKISNSMPFAGKPADLRTGSRTVHGATIAPEWPTRHWIDPNIRESSSDFVHPSGPIGPARRPLRNRHDPSNRTPLVAKTCSQVQRGAISAAAAGRDVSPRLGGHVRFRSNLEQSSVRGSTRCRFSRIYVPLGWSPASRGRQRRAAADCFIEA